jgi:hypothetical protein
MHPHQYQELRDAGLAPPPSSDAGLAPPARPSQSPMAARAPPGGPLRNPRQASAYLLERHGIVRAPATLNKLRVVGGGPAFRKVGTRNVAYEEAALDEWASTLVSRPLHSTSEAA